MRDEESRRQEIRQAVAECVATEGMRGATMRKIAEHLNVSTGMISYYYKNKRELIADTIAHAGERFSERTLELAGAESGLGWVEADFDVALAHRGDDSPPWSLWFEWWAEATRDPELRKYHVETAVKRQRKRAEAVQRASDSGEISTDLDPVLVADLLGALFQGLGIKMTVDAEVFPRERAAQVVRLMLSLLTQTASQAKAQDTGSIKASASKSNGRADGHAGGTRSRRTAVRTSSGS
jgi:AcrR family transcriptional regulator